jgi:hypothetical protein
MRKAQEYLIKNCAVILSVFVLNAFGQEPAATPEKKVDTIAPEKTDAKSAAVKTIDVKAEATKAPAAKKMVQDATINLQTTITGNQEQPRVLYILPWQSPQTANVDFEPLDSQQKAVFGHIEREELRRELESAGEVQ